MQCKLLQDMPLELYLSFHYISHGITISPPVDLSAPVALLRPPALVTLSRDAVHAYGAGDIVC